MILLYTFSRLSRQKNRFFQKDRWPFVRAPVVFEEKEFFMSRKITALSPEKLQYRCEGKNLSFPATEEIPLLEGPVGQERAIRAIDFGLRIKSPGYNLFAVGEPGCGKSSTITAMVKELAQTQDTPNDWAYVYNFDNPRSPIALSLYPGQGRVFVRQMRELTEVLKKNIPAALEDKDFETRRGEILDNVSRENTIDLAAFQKTAREAGYAFEQVESDFGFIPVKDGKKLHRDDFEALPEEEKAHYNESLLKLQEGLREITRQAHKRDEDARRKIETLSREQVRFAVDPFLALIQSDYSRNEKIGAYLKSVMEDILDHYQEFIPGQAPKSPVLPGATEEEAHLSKYSVNLVVDRKGKTGAPVIYENHPTFQNLIGKMEYVFHYGVASTGFEKIQSGVMHMANGGYLVLDALEVLRSPFAWEAIKNSLKSGLIKIEDMGEQYRMFATGSLKPEPIPLDIKVILVGTPLMYYQLLSYEEDFRKLFKVKADFGNSMKRSDDAIRNYALFIGSICKEENLLPCDESAVCAVIEQGVRLAEDQSRLSTSFSQVADLIRESSFWARKEKAQNVSRPHVRKAVMERKHRYDRTEERLGELIGEGTIMVRTKGEVVGQVNGLSVYTLGDYRFGKPTRITAKVFLGKAGMVNIEREVKLSGSIHNKGVMIVSSYLAMRYATDFPLSLTASMTFEQTYDEIEGDSATAAELIALTSALSNTPVFQGMAITGSMDQHGMIQPIGGVNEKIEGFFNTCRDHGLDGKQGVVIPKTNLKNLVLDDEVVQAVRKGLFSIYAVQTIDEAIELMTGVKAGERGKRGLFPKDTFNRRVEDRLRSLAERLKELQEEEPVKEEKED